MIMAILNVFLNIKVMKCGIPIPSSLSLVIKNMSLAITLLNLFFFFLFLCVCVCWGGEHMYGTLYVEVTGQPLVLVFTFFLVWYSLFLLFGTDPSGVCLSLPPSCSRGTRITDVATMHSYMSSGCLNPGSHVCIANALPTEPSSYSKSCYLQDSLHSENTH